jgi:hypothetical protein
MRLTTPNASIFSKREGAAPFAAPAAPGIRSGVEAYAVPAPAPVASGSGMRWAVAAGTMVVPGGACICACAYASMAND